MGVRVFWVDLQGLRQTGFGQRRLAFQRVNLREAREGGPILRLELQCGGVGLLGLIRPPEGQEAVAHQEQRTLFVDGVVLQEVRAELDGLRKVALGSGDLGQREMGFIVLGIPGRCLL
jgi:hypothetical protein